jgi:hypothetical protein
MRFKVVGSSRQTGGRMELEIDAASKGAAEQEATRRGMDVRHATPLPDADGHNTAPRARSASGGGFRRLIVVLLVLLAAAAGAYVWLTCLLYTSPSPRDRG